MNFQKKSECAYENGLMNIENIISMRVGSRYRALGIENGETIIWFWIGKYKQYSALLQ